MSLLVEVVGNGLGVFSKKGLLQEEAETKLSFLFCYKLFIDGRVFEFLKVEPQPGFS